MWNEGCATTVGAVGGGMRRSEMQAGIGLNGLIPAIFFIELEEKSSLRKTISTINGTAMRVY